MAHDTPSSCRNLALYEIYVRNHGPNGTFADVEADLPRIKSMRVDIIWFMPIHPIGQMNKKGSLGCPYSIADYREVNPEYGTKADFSRLIERAHELGLKVMIDVVYNHTSHDSVLVRDHPEWFHQDENGTPVTTVPDWTDVIDLKHPNDGLTAYLIETLQGWARFGVDGFRCDVASLLPEDFWVKARREVSKVKKGVLWLAESVHAGWVGFRRAHGLYAISDSELYRAFDLTYDYDIWAIWQTATLGKEPVGRYLEALRLQDCIYPANYVKMRCAENHDQARIMAMAPSRAQAMAWTAFQAFNKGAFLIYAGQESAVKHTPSLFDIDKVEWGDYGLQPYLTTLAGLKKDKAQLEGQLILLNDEPVIQATWYLPGNSLYGVFNVSKAKGEVKVKLPRGAYTNLLDGKPVQVERGLAAIPKDAFVVRYSGKLSPQPFYSNLLDFHYKGRQ